MARLHHIILALVIISIILPSTAVQVDAANIRLSDYWYCHGLGDVWTYGYSQPTGLPDFTVAITLMTEGDFFGRLRIGDWLDPGAYQIFSYDANYFYLYYDHGRTFNPPAQIPLTYPLNTVVDNPNKPPPTTDAWYFLKLEQFTVPAGTFKDILVKLDLDKNFGPNAANSLFGLPPSITYGVTHAQWYARSVGQIQDMDFDAQTGLPGDTFKLKSTNARPGAKGLLARLMLLMY